MAVEKGGILCIGIDDSHVKACLCQQVSGDWRLASWLEEQTPLLDRAQFLTQGERRTVSSHVLWAMETLGHFLGCDLQRALLPALRAKESHAAQFKLDRILVTASLSAPLKVWVLALTSLALDDLKAAIHGQGAHVIGVTLLGESLPAWRLRMEITKAQPDLLLICGGYDGGFEHRIGSDFLIPLLHECLESYESPLQVIYAGRSEIAEDFQATLSAVGRIKPISIPNISPHPEYFRFGPLQEALAAWQEERDLQDFNELATHAWGLEETGMPTMAESFTGGLRVWQGHSRPRERLHGVLQSAGRRLHVLLPANTDDSALIWHALGEELPDQLKDWPPVGLASGLSPSSFSGKEMPILDPNGFLPLIAPLFAMEPEAAWSVLTQDLLVMP